MCFGYELVGDDGWQGDLVFEEESGVFLVVFLMMDGIEVELWVGMFYLEDGVCCYYGLIVDGCDVFVELQVGFCEQGGDMLIYFVMVEIGSYQFEGCGLECVEIDCWLNYLMDFMFVIDICLGEFGVWVQYVLLVYLQFGGNIGVCLVDQDGVMWECIMCEDDSVINLI